MRKTLSRWAVGAIAVGMIWGAAPARGQDAEPLPGPAEVPAVTLGPTLPTHPVRRTAGGFINQQTNKHVLNERWVDASLLPRDKQGIWVLEFAFRPVRIMTIDVPGKGRRQVHYMYYQVINRTGKPRMFVPQFTLVTDTGKRYEDSVLPKAVELIQTREDPTIKLLGAVNIMGVIPPSTKEGIDDAVFGVAVWEDVDPHADRFQIYVRGLSDGYMQAADPPAEGAAVAKAPVKYKTLRIDFIRRGDQFAIHEKEIQLLDPPYEWVYW